jgi:NarL family two-component system response regulator LiaR
VQEQERPANHLSPREREILSRVAQGMTNQQIADDLRMSLGTVKVHIRNIFQKFDLPNRTEAAVFAIREGLIESSQVGDTVN